MYWNVRAVSIWQVCITHKCQPVSFPSHLFALGNMWAHDLQETFRNFLPAARTSSTVLEVEFHPDMSPRPGPLEQGAIESPKKLEELDRQEEVLAPILNKRMLLDLPLNAQSLPAAALYCMALLWSLPLVAKHGAVHTA